MTNQNDNWNEDRLGELLRAPQYPARTPDEQFLARVRAESAAAFLSAHAKPASASREIQAQSASER